MILSISGRAGAGKNTVGERLAQELKYKFYCIGDLRRALAKEKGLTLAELNEIGKKESWTDSIVDQKAKTLGKTQDNFVIVGRTAFHFIPHSFKIFLDIEREEAARRVYEQGRADETYHSVEEAKKKLEHRDTSDDERYKKYYQISMFDKKNYDVVIDTTKFSVKEVIQKIKKKLSSQAH